MLIISLITSVVIEITQLLIGRTFDVDDIILNLIGGLLGFLLYVFIYFMENKFPKVFSTNIFKNIFVVVSIGLTILLYFTSTLWGILR